MWHFFNTLLDLALDTAPWLFLGLIAAGLVKAWIPESTVSRWIGGDGIVPITLGSLIGAPLPLCSCGVIPMAMGLRRDGASKPATVSFLVATPETGVDSIALSWVLLGPFLTIVRPVAAVISAIFSGILVLFVTTRDSDTSNRQPSSAESCDRDSASSSCCRFVVKEREKRITTWEGIRYAMRDLWDDLAIWLIGGLIITAAVMTWIQAGELHAFVKSGWLAMLTMVLISIPIYVCATASTPVAAAMLYSGVSPGMALAFMIAGPATNLATLTIVRQELGTKTLIAYLTGIITSALLLGFASDLIAAAWSFDTVPLTHLSSQQETWLPLWMAWGTLLWLAGISLGSLYRKFRKP